MLYTLTNIALRNCVELDAYLVSAVKAAPTVIVLGPLLAMAPLSRRLSAATPSERTAGDPTVFRRRIPQFILASFLAQFFGNAAFQKALELIGLAASVPITLGVLIVGGAVLGALILKEPVSTRKVVAMITLIVAVIVLSIPAPERQSGDVMAPGPESTLDSQLESPLVDAQESPASPESSVSTDPVQIIVGSLWAALSGLAYSFFGVTMRQTLQSGIPSQTLMFLSGLTGTITLWGYCFLTLGYGVIASTTSIQWATMLLAGFCNFSAFIAITAALRTLPVVAVNLINASQVAMAAVAGVLLFGEPITFYLALGIGLTFVGLVILARRTRAPIVITD